MTVKVYRETETYTKSKSYTCYDLVSGITDKDSYVEITFLDGETFKQSKDGYIIEAFI